MLRSAVGLQMHMPAPHAARARVAWAGPGAHRLRLAQAAVHDLHEVRLRHDDERHDDARGFEEGQRRGGGACREDAGAGAHRCPSIRRASHRWRRPAQVRRVSAFPLPLPFLEEIAQHRAAAEVDAEEPA